MLMLQYLYQLLTNRHLRVIAADPEIDFTDHGYQSQLPDHARNTAVQAIRTNLKGSELSVISSIVRRRQLAQDIVNRHTEDRARARQTDPVRYGHKLTLGEQAIRQPPPPDYSYSFHTDDSLTPQPYMIGEGEGDGIENNNNTLQQADSLDVACSSSSANIKFRSIPRRDGAGDCVYTKHTTGVCPVTTTTTTTTAAAATTTTTAAADYYADNDDDVDD